MHLKHLKNFAYGYNGPILSGNKVRTSKACTITVTEQRPSHPRGIVWTLLPGDADAAWSAETGMGIFRSARSPRLGLPPDSSRASLGSAITTPTHQSRHTSADLTRQESSRRQRQRHCCIFEFVSIPKADLHFLHHPNVPILSVRKLS